MTTRVKITNEGPSKVAVQIQDTSNADSKWPEIILAPGESTEPHAIYVYPNRVIKVSER